MKRKEYKKILQYRTDGKQKETPRPNRRQTRIQNLRRELRQLRRRYRDSSPTERVGLTQLRATLRSQLTSLRKAENTGRKTRERAKKRATFTANPYKFARSLLNKERSGKLETPLEEVEKYLNVTPSDPNRLPSKQGIWDPYGPQMGNYMGPIWANHMGPMWVLQQGFI